MRSRSVFVSLLVVVGSVGCGSVSSKSDGGTDGGMDMAPPTVDEACAMFATAFCGRLQTCAPFVGQIWYGDRTTCETRAALGCMLDFDVTDTNHTTTDMVACAHDATTATCSDLVANMLPSSCQIKPGVRLDGQVCGSSWQCMSTHCEKTTGDCGVCAPRAAAGGACMVDEGCTNGLVCAAMKCVAPVGLGVACGDGAPCRADLFCSMVSQMCEMPRGVGQSCNMDSNACDGKNGVGCNPFNNQCATVAAAKGGSACGIVNNTLTLCIVNNTCNGLSLIPLSTMGTCPNPAADGQACTDTVHCMAPANCVGGLCRLPSSASCSK